MPSTNRLTYIIIAGAILLVSSIITFTWQQNLTDSTATGTPLPSVLPQSTISAELITNTTGPTYTVVKVVDGDTLDVSIDGQTKRIRLIGLDTPETVDPRKPVQCFGKEASNYAKSLLEHQVIRLESDGSQGDIDTYGRLLRYMYLPDGRNYNQLMILEGYAHEYTYDKPYRYQVIFKNAQKQAEAAKSGLWSDTTCQGNTTKSATATPTPTPTSSTEICAFSQTTQPVIKGNISSSGQKIYHTPNDSSYGQTVIDTTKGERWFCTTQQAQQQGWQAVHAN